jgi:hypothetical protein
MKGVIPKALKQMVTEKYGADTWKKALSQAGIEREPLMLPISDVDDSVVLEMVEGVCGVLGITLAQAADAFGAYWMTEFAPTMYKSHFSKPTSVREFLLQMDEVHEITTRNMPNAHPPRFGYEELDDGSLVMEYKSSRDLMDIFVGLVKGVGAHVGETVDIQRRGGTKLHIRFS